MAISLDRSAKPAAPQSPQVEAVWRPIVGTSQEIALDSRCHHTLYCGTRGPGKTDVQLMRFRRNVGVGYGAFWRGVIFDREYKNLDDIVTKSKRWFPRFDDGAKFLESASSYKWVWPTGEELLFRAVKKPSDYWEYHGHEYPFIGWNELTKFPTLELYDMFMSCNRSSFRPEDYPLHIDGELFDKTGLTQFINQQNRKARQIFLPEIPLEVFSTTNPYGVGHNAVKRRFIDGHEYGEVVRTQITVTDPKTGEEKAVEKTQVAIFGSYVENVYLTAEYIAELVKQTDENIKKAWLFGDWDIVAGGAFDDLWKKGVHVVPRFVIPESWAIDRTYDDGSTHPFSVGWWAEANGEEATIIDDDGQVYSFCPPPGTLVQFFEYYGCQKDKNGNLDIGSNKGLKMSAAKIAENIVNIEMALQVNGWIHKPVEPGPADNRIRQVIDEHLDTIEKLMADNGVVWEESDKSPGSRIVGMQLFRDRLEASTRGEGKGIYFMRNCRASIATIPTLPRDEKKPDDVDTEAEDHPYDMTRYRMLKGNNRIATSLPVQFSR
jgi:hypothetical protein